MFGEKAAAMTIKETSRPINIKKMEWPSFMVHLCAATSSQVKGKKIFYNSLTQTDPDIGYKNDLDMLKLFFNPSILH